MAGSFIRVKSWVDKSNLLEATQSLQQSWDHILLWGTNVETFPGDTKASYHRSCEGKENHQSVYGWPEACGPIHLHILRLLVG